MKYLFDTDVIIDAMHDKGITRAGLLSLVSEGAALSVISYGELVDGVIGPRSSPEMKTQLDVFLSPLTMLVVTREVAEIFARIRNALRVRGQTIPAQDLWIASTALEFDLVLVSRNLRHFKRIPGLQMFGDVP